MITRCLLFLCLLHAATLSAQGTTEEEFLYCTKGYGAQLAMGLDPQKSGYTLRNLDTTVVEFDTFSRRIIYTGLYRTGRSKAVALIATFRRSDQPENVHYCIPGKSSPDSMWDRCLKDLVDKFNGNPEAFSAVMLSFMRLNAEAFTE